MGEFRSTSREAQIASLVVLLALLTLISYAAVYSTWFFLLTVVYMLVLLLGVASQHRSLGGKRRLLALALAYTPFLIKTLKADHRMSSFVVYGGAEALIFLWIGAILVHEWILRKRA
jgi:hypothetical protein